MIVGDKVIILSSHYTEEHKLAGQRGSVVRNTKGGNHWVMLESGTDHIFISTELRLISALEQLAEEAI